MAGPRPEKSESPYDESDKMQKSVGESTAVWKREEKKTHSGERKGLLWGAAGEIREVVDGEASGAGDRGTLRFASNHRACSLGGFLPAAEIPSMGLGWAKQQRPSIMMGRMW